MTSFRDNLKKGLTRKAPEWVETYLAWGVGAVFGVASLALLWLLATIFLNHHAARSWVVVPVRVASAEVRTSRSGTVGRTTVNSTIRAEYRYDFGGREYVGKRVDFGFGSDNFSGDRRARQMDMLRSPLPVAYVNPARPQESVIDRSLPVEQVNFGILFLFFPCGLGTAMVLGAATGLASRLGMAWASRLFGPAFGLVHSVPAFYAPVFAPRDLGPFGWLLVAVAVVVFLVSIRSLLRWAVRPGIPEAGSTV